jgi:hypothetical protein
MVLVRQEHFVRYQTMNVGGQVEAVVSRIGVAEPARTDALIQRRSLRQQPPYSGK